MSRIRFEPEVFYNSLGSHPPLARVADGDTVVAETLDARGYDRTLRSATPRPTR